MPHHPSPDEVDRLAQLCRNAYNSFFGVTNPILWEDAYDLVKAHWRHVARAVLADREALVNALRGAVDWMAEDGCDCGTDEPGTCALYVAEATLREINNG